MPTLTGHTRDVLDPSIDAAVTAAIGHSACKVLVSQPDGSHVERVLPGCDGVATFHATHCHMHLERYRPPLRAELTPGSLSGLPVDRINAYISPPGEGTVLHFDERTVVIVQLAGTKLWEVSAAPAVRSPQGNCVAPPNGGTVAYRGELLRVPSELERHMLRPGDWLVVPKATWHRTVSTVGSVSVTLALPAD